MDLDHELTLDYGRYRTDGHEPHGETQLIVHSGIGTRIHARFRIKTHLHAPDDDVQLTVQAFGQSKPGPALRVATSSIARRGVPQGSAPAFRSGEPEVSSVR